LSLWACALMSVSLSQHQTSATSNFLMSSSCHPLKQATIKVLPLAKQPTQPSIIDKQALQRHQERALSINKQDADFLLRYAADDLALRLSTITKTWENAADLNSASSVISDMLESRVKPDRLVQTKSPAFTAPTSTKAGWLISWHDAGRLHPHGIAAIVSLC